MATAGALTYLCLDPLIKAAYLLRCFYGESLHTGEDLRAALKQFQPGAAATVVALFILLSGSVPPGTAVPSAIPNPELRTSNSEISPPDLDRSIEQVLSRREFNWRLPRQNPAGDSPVATPRGCRPQSLILRRIPGRRDSHANTPGTRDSSRVQGSRARAWRRCSGSCSKRAPGRRAAQGVLAYAALVKETAILAIAAMFIRALLAANDAKREEKILAVTILTSLDDAACKELGLPPPAEAVPTLAELAFVAGCDGVVCAATDVRAVRARAGARLAGHRAVDPGRRPAAAGSGGGRARRGDGAGVGAGGWPSAAR